MAIFGPKSWVNPFGKMSIFRLFELLVFVAYKGVFSFQSVVKDIFLAYIAYMAYIALKKKVGKMAIFGPKPCVNPSGKMSIFRLFEFFFFINQKGVVLFQNFVNEIFLAYISLKEKKNVNFSSFLNSYFYSLERRINVLEYHKRYFPCLYCLKKKVGKMAIFGPKPWVIPFGKVSIFRLF